MNRTFYLPVYAGLEDRHVRRVIDTLKASICKLKGKEGGTMTGSRQTAHNDRSRTAL